jgi:hypothetical protein
MLSLPAFQRVPCGTLPKAVLDFGLRPPTVERDADGCRNACAERRQAHVPDRANAIRDVGDASFSRELGIGASVSRRRASSHVTTAGMSAAISVAPSASRRGQDGLPRSAPLWCRRGTPRRCATAIRSALKTTFGRGLRARTFPAAPPGEPARPDPLRMGAAWRDGSDAGRQTSVAPPVGGPGAPKSGRTRLRIC